MTNMQVRWLEADEAVRHNKATEQEAYRHNVEQERLTAQGNSLTERQIAEMTRSHQATEALTDKQLNETIRHQIAADTEAMRSHMVSEAEINRHNEATEQLSKSENDIKKMLGLKNIQATYAGYDTQKQIADADRQMQAYFKQVQADETARFNDAQITKWQRDWQVAVRAAMRDAERLEVEKAYLKDSQKTSRSVRFANYTKGIESMLKTATGVFDIVDKVRKPAPNPIGFR